MDVLKSWKPSINWGNFEKGDVSQEVWEVFQTIVQLCHAHAYWKNQAIQSRNTVLPSSDKLENEFQRRKLKRDRKSEISRREALMHRAAHQTTEKLSELSNLINGDESSVDVRLFRALNLAIRPVPTYQNARCEAITFEDFNTHEQLKGSVESIANRWLRLANIDKNSDPEAFARKS